MTKGQWALAALAALWVTYEASRFLGGLLTL